MGLRPHAVTQSCRKASSNLDSVSQHVETKGLYGAIVSFPKRKPFLTNMLLCTGLTFIADLQVQWRSGKPVDVKRSAFFCAFGLYQGVAQWFVYVVAFSRMFPGAIRFANMPMAEKLRNPAGMKQLVGQIGVDLFAYVPFVYYPVFYAFQGYFHEDSLQTCVDRYKSNFAVDVVAQVAFWGPADIICFSAPAWMRLPISHLGGFGWNSILSWLRGDVEESLFGDCSVNV